RGRYRGSGLSHRTWHRPWRRAGDENAQGARVLLQAAEGDNRRLDARGLWPRSQDTTRSPATSSPTWALLVAAGRGVVRRKVAPAGSWNSRLRDGTRMHAAPAAVVHTSGDPAGQEHEPEHRPRTDAEVTPVEAARPGDLGHLTGREATAECRGDLA